MTTNRPIVSRHLFLHVFACGRRLELHVAKTKTHIRFSFLWFPAIKNLAELGEIQREFIDLRDFWMGENLGSKFGIQSWTLHEAFQCELFNLINQLTPP